MFSNKRYLTKGVQADIPFELQIFLWECIKAVPEPDYLQIFRLSDFNGKQRIIHEQEIPEYKREYLLVVNEPINQKVYVIDDGDHSTMLLAEEY
ncbi:MAG: DUF960 domain-containing protein [Ruminococcus sp.]